MYDQDIHFQHLFTYSRPFHPFGDDQRSPVALLGHEFTQWSEYLGLIMIYFKDTIQTFTLVTNKFEI